MGRIYEAIEEPGGARVAVKVLVLGSKVDWRLRELFERSTNILMGLSHPAHPRVHAFEQADGGRFVLVRDAFDGGTLEERIAKQDRRLAPSDITRLLTVLLDLLAYLQSRLPPVIHRDIKPANVMFRTLHDDAPVLVDFDTVAAPEGQRSGATIVGTPGYTAPEQFAGEASPSTDVYSLGATMLFVITHTPADLLPRRAGQFDVAGALAPLDPTTRRVLARMIDTDRNRRYATAAEALADLRRGSAPALHATGGTGTRALPLILAAMAFVCLVSFTGVTVFFLRSRPPKLPVTAPATAPVASGPAPGTHHCQSQDLVDCTAMCQKHDPASCANLGYMYDMGVGGVSKDNPRAATLYKEACDGGNPTSCANLGDMYVNGRGVPKDEVRANPLFKQACDRGNALGCVKLGYSYDLGRGVEKDPVRAFSFYDQGCTGGNSDGCGNLGYLYSIGKGVPKDEAHAFTLERQACDKGSMRACGNLGYLYEIGGSVTKDVAAALALYSQACVAGDAPACSALGRMYSKALGVPKDEARGAVYYRQACDGGYATACTSLGYAYAKAQGVPKDVTRAAALYKQGCDGGNATGCANLGDLYATGSGVTKDDTKAIALDTQGCQGGAGNACGNLGYLTEHGRNGPTDRATYVDFYRQGCKAANDWSCNQLKRLGETQ